MRNPFKHKTRIPMSMLVGIFLQIWLDNLCFAQQTDSSKVIEIAIIDFLYVSEGFHAGKQLEKDVLISGIDRALNIIKANDYKFSVKRVVKGTLNYFIFREAQKKATATTYDLGIWGHVTPYATAGNYDLQMMVFTNPSKLEQCLFYYELEVRDGRIRRWNNRSCDLPESGMALIPAVLCYKLITFLNSKREINPVEQSQLYENIKRKLIPLIDSIPTDETLVWHPEQDCDADKLLGARFGLQFGLQLEFDDGNEFELPLPIALLIAIYQNTVEDVAYNWPVDGVMVEQRLMAFSHTLSKKSKKDKKWVWLATGVAAVGAGTSFLLLSSENSAPRKGKVFIEIDQIQK